MADDALALPPKAAKERRPISRRRLLGTGLATAVAVTGGNFIFNREFREKVEVVITTTWYNDLFHPILLIPWAKEDRHYHTRLNLIGSHRDAAHTRLTIRAYQVDGRPAGEWGPIELPSTGFLNLELGALTGGTPIDGPLKIYYEVNVPVRDYLLRTTVDYYDAQGIASVHANPSYKATTGAHELFHQFTARLDGHNGYLNTNQFLARVALDGPQDSYLAIQNCREGNSGMTAHPTLELFNERGEGLKQMIEIPPDGSTFLSIRELFPKAVPHLNGRPGGIRITDQHSFLWTNAFLLDRRTGSLSVDHLHWT
jgi:hypothetical protein